MVTVLGPRAAGQIEVATFRSDAAYSDGRHPDSVTFTTAEHDAQRRDFTINGLFFDPIAEQVVDYVDGQEDLRRGIIRAIGDPRLRLSEDKLRMLRAVRFAATFGFTIEPATLRAIQEMAADITTVSAERIGMEIRRMLLDANRATALALLRDTNLLPQVLPEVAAAGIRRRSTKPQRRARRDSKSRRSHSRSPRSSTVLDSPHSPLRTPRSLVGRRLRYTNKEIDRTAWLLANLSSHRHGLRASLAPLATPAHPRRRGRAHRAARSHRRRQPIQRSPSAANDWPGQPSDSTHHRSSMAPT